MINSALDGRPYAGNPHVRFDKGEVAPAKPRRGSLLYKKLWVAVFAGAWGYFACAVDFPAAVDGVITLTTAGTYSAAVPTSTKLVVNANGSVTLSSATKYTGTVEIESGSTLVVPNTTILANAPINVKSGGTLNPTFASPGQWNKVFLQPITIAGAGNGGIGAFKFSLHSAVELRQETIRLIDAA